MSVNLTPWNGLDVEKLKVWVHRILPLVYDDSLSYYEVLAKVGAKMNEVIEGLNANNEQVEKVTGFTIEQVQNLTEAFNNFQQSMLTKQENFENKVLDSQQTFETQLKGDIANWEATTEEKFRQQYVKDSTALNNAYAKFLADYQKQFGVVQSFGDSETDVISQRGVTNNAFVFRGNIESTTYDLNNAYLSGIYNFYQVEFTNGPDDCDGGILLAYQRTETANEPDSKPLYTIQMFYKFENKMLVLYASRTLFNQNHENSSDWFYYYPKNEVGNSKIDTLSQYFISHNAFVFREYIDEKEYDLNNAKLTGIYNFFNATLSNAPADFSSGMVIAYQRTGADASKNPSQTFQMAYKTNSVTRTMDLYATRVLYTGTEEWRYCNDKDNAFVFRTYVEDTTYDLNNAYLSGIYNFYNVTFENGPDNCTGGILLAYQRTETANEPDSKPQYTVQMFYKYEGQKLLLYAIRMINNINHNYNTQWYYYYPKNEVGNSKFDTLSQDFISHNAFVFRENIEYTEYDLDDAKLSGIYNFFNATLSNAPADFSSGMVIAYQRTGASADSDPEQTFQMAYKTDTVTRTMYLYATRVLYRGGEEWKYGISLKNKSFVVIGDSWSAYPKWIPNNFKSWYPDNTPLEYNEIWWYLLSKNEEMNIYQINAYTGTSIAIDDNNPEYLGYITRVINSFSNTITTVLKPDYYIILGGANDNSRDIDPGEVTYSYSDTTDKQSIPALSHILSLLRQYNPNAKIFFFTQSETRSIYTDGFKEVCEHFNVHFEQLPSVPYNNGHPTNAGQKTVYEIIAKTLKLYS